MIKTNGVPHAALRSIGKPTASFPGAIVTDQHLAIAVDRQQTKLAAILSDTATSMQLVNPSMATQWSLLSIDDEIVQVTGVPTGNAVPITRGFDGTTPAIHLSGATVSGLVDAYHHNTLAAEIQAIENALGANLSRIPTSSQIVSKNYDFPAQTPGGNLIVGNNVITLAPVPLGVNGTDTRHYLYISGGTGAPEAVLITGGNAVSGAASGTVIVNCANAHSGAWTISSATAGIAEAIGDGTRDVYIPVGNHEIYAPISVKYGTYLHGGGTLASALLAAGSSSMTVLSLDSIPGFASVTIGNLQIDASVHFPDVNTVTAISVISCYNVRISALLIHHCSKGIVLDHVTNVMVDSINTIGNVTLFVGVTTNSGTASVYPWPGALYSRYVMISNWRAYDVTRGANANVPVMTFKFAASCYVNNVQMQTGDTSRMGISVAAHCEDVIFSAVLLLEFNPLMDITDSGWTRIENSSFAAAPNGVGLTLHSGYCTLIQNNHFNGTATKFIDIFSSGSGYEPDYVMITDNQIAGVTTGQGILIEPGINRFMIVGNLFLNYANPGPTYDIYIAPGASDYFTIIGNTFAVPTGAPPSTNPVYDNATGTHKFIQTNAGYGLYAQLGATLASGAAITVTNRIHKVSGSAAITNINYLGTTILSGELLYLIPTGAFTLTTAGNIAAASTAVVGKTMLLIFDASGPTGKWYPSY